MNLINVVVAIVAIALVGNLVLSLVRKKGKSCDCEGCSGCSMNNMAQEIQDKKHRA